jgi:hypothetical protein
MNTKRKAKNWHASLRHNPEVKRSGNSMTMKHYVEHILPKHITSARVFGSFLAEAARREVETVAQAKEAILREWRATRQPYP